MGNIYRKISGDNTVAISLLKGMLAGITATLAGTAILSWLIIREMLQETSIGYCAMGVILIASGLASFMAARSAGKGIAYLAGLSGLIYFAVLIGANALFFKGEFQAMGVTALLVLAGSGTSMLLAGRNKKTRKPSRRKIRHP